VIKYDVLNRYSGEVQFAAEIDCNENASRSIKLGLAVRWGIKSNANLSDANLSDADLHNADLSYANLCNADLSNADLCNAKLRNTNLSYANLSNANLYYANLCYANLRNTNLSDAKLRNANLRNANLFYANLSNADLCNANLRNTNLSNANLSNADLRNADLRIFKHDIWAVCMYAIAEVPALIGAIKEGRIDGSQYEGECCCLCGTLEKGLKSAIDIRDASSPAEQWFSMIRKGDKPDDNYASETALKWVEEFYAMVGGKS